VRCPNLLINSNHLLYVSSAGNPVRALHRCDAGYRLQLSPSVDIQRHHLDQRDLVLRRVPGRQLPGTSPPSAAPRDLGLVRSAGPLGRRAKPASPCATATLLATMTAQLWRHQRHSGFTSPPTNKNCLRACQPRPPSSAFDRTSPGPAAARLRRRQRRHLAALLRPARHLERRRLLPQTACPATILDLYKRASTSLWLAPPPSPRAAPHHRAPACNNFDQGQLT